MPKPSQLPYPQGRLRQGQAGHTAADLSAGSLLAVGRQKQVGGEGVSCFSIPSDIQLFFLTIYYWKGEFDQKDNNNYKKILHTECSN